MNKSKRTSIVCVTGIDDGSESALEVTELQISAPPSKEAVLISEAEAKLANMTKEREIFLRAALQLLDKREHPGQVKKKYKNPFKLKSSRKKNGSVLGTEDSVMDVIRYGTLRKANRYHRGIVTVEKWRRKFIELRHGMFSYENDNIKWLRGVKKKVILLSAQTCKCRPFQLEGPDGNKAFELSIYGGPRRLWRAESTEERDAWVRAINTAMSGSAGDSGVSSGISPPATNGVPSSPNLSRRKSATTFDPERPLSSISSALTNISNSVSDYYSTTVNHSTNGTEINPSQSFEGAAAPYAHDISRYTSIQTAVRSAVTAEQCRDITCGIADSLANTSLMIPILFVKRQMNLSNFAMSTQDSLTAQTLQSVTSSQVWKDLQRDSLRINGVVVSGETEGPEAMIGCLVRTILDKAELIRWISKDYYENVMAKRHTRGRNEASMAVESGQVPAGLNVAVSESAPGADSGGVERGNLKKRRSISFPEAGEMDVDEDGSVRSSMYESSPMAGVSGISMPSRSAIADGILSAMSCTGGCGTDITALNAPGEAPSRPSGESPSAPIATGSAPAPSASLPYLHSFDITEGQVLACARDLLVLCNRTQSGGDTYFCIDAMFCNHDYCILTPVISDHENPLEITVDIVEGQSKGHGRHSVKEAEQNAAMERSDSGNKVVSVGPGADTNEMSGHGSTQDQNMGPSSNLIELSGEQGSAEGGEVLHNALDSSAAGTSPAVANHTRSLENAVGVPVTGNVLDGSRAGAIGGASGSRHPSVYSTASSMERIRGSGYDIPSATTSISGEETSSVVSGMGRDVYAASVTSSSSANERVVPLTYVNLSRHKPTLPPVDISSVNSKPPQVPHPPTGVGVASGSSNSAVATDAMASASVSVSRTAAVETADGEGWTGNTSAATNSSTVARTPLSRTSSDLQSQCSFHSLPSLEGRSTPPPGMDTATPGSTTAVLGTPAVAHQSALPGSVGSAAVARTAQFVVEDEDCMSPFLRRPQFPYEVAQKAPASVAQLPLPEGVTVSQSTLMDAHLVGARRPNIHEDESDGDSSSSSSDCSDSDEESKCDSGRGSGMMQNVPFARSHAGMSTAHSRDHSTGSDASKASLQVQRDPQDVPALPSAEEEDAHAMDCNYAGGPMCIRVQVRSHSKYRLCTLDPQDEISDTWATVTGEFEQCFFIKSNCNGRPVISDRLVKLTVDPPLWMGGAGTRGIVPVAPSSGQVHQ